MRSLYSGEVERRQEVSAIDALEAQHDGVRQAPIHRCQRPEVAAVLAQRIEKRGAVPPHVGRTLGLFLDGAFDRERVSCCEGDALGAWT